MGDDVDRMDEKLEDDRLYRRDLDDVDRFLVRTEVDYDANENQAAQPSTLREKVKEMVNEGKIIVTGEKGDRHLEFSPKDKKEIRAALKEGRVIDPDRSLRVIDPDRSLRVIDPDRSL